MNEPFTIGIDTGTSGCKAVLLDARAHVIASSWRPYPTRRRTDGEVTQDPDDWMRATGITIRECVRAAEGRAIEGIGVTAPAHVAVLVDGDGQPLTRSLLAFDARPASIARRLRESYGEGFFETTLVELTEGWTLPQLAWLHSERPELWSRIRCFLLEKDYVVFRLTGAIGTDPSDAAGTAMLDRTSGEWALDLCADVGLAADQLPPIRPATDHAGGLSRDWARRTGLKTGTPVVVGATDTAAELVSVGATCPGRSLVKVASTGTVVAVSAEPHPDRRVLTYPHTTPGLWYTVAATSTAATAYHWLRSLIAGDPENSRFATMNRLAGRVPAGAEGVLFLPFLDGERSPFWDRDLRAAFLGVSAAHRRGHFCRAVLEGVAYSLRCCQDILLRLGLEIELPDFTGGGLRSGLWRTIVASALDREGTLPAPQGPAVGAALLAARSAQARPGRRVVRPRRDWAATYDDGYATYLEAAEKLAGVSHALVESARRQD